jgi:hypothetical protein
MINSLVRGLRRPETPVYPSFDTKESIANEREELSCTSIPE